jgi:hypothetical protein
MSTSSADGALSQVRATETNFVEVYSSRLQALRDESPPSALESLYQYALALTDGIRTRKPRPNMLNPAPMRRRIALDARGTVKLRAFLPLGQIKRLPR